ncbi:MAG: RES domain-containing protein [Muribaculaceae bacterium]|nr:RES domain-containing protein [Muribaculaceae bacterium]
MKLRELRNQLNELPKGIEDGLSAKFYLEALKNSFIGKVKTFINDPEGKKEFNHFEGIKDKTDTGISKFLGDLTDIIDDFNKKCLKCLQPDSVSNDFDVFKALFFNGTDIRKDRKIFLENIKKDTDFYRIRGTGDKNKYELFDHKGMYMMGPEHSARVGTARFNLSGYACLYLAESLYLAWEECRRPDFHTANFVRFCNCKELTVFNLVIPDESKLRSSAAFFRTYLSLACSVKAKDEEKDHWQYRISNLFIRMIYQVEGKKIDGIKYISSKRFENENFRIEYAKDCAAYVFPPKDIDGKHCKKLASMFEMTEAYSYFYFKIYGRNFISPKKAATREYDKTIFYFLETQLKEEKTIPCKEIIDDKITP